MLGSKSRNRTSCRESWDMDRDRNCAPRNVTLETPSKQLRAAALSCFFCLYLSLRAGMLMFLAMTGYKHRQRISRNVK